MKTQFTVDPSVLNRYYLVLVNETIVVSDVDEEAVGCSGCSGTCYFACENDCKFDCSGDCGMTCVGGSSNNGGW